MHVSLINDDEKNKNFILSLNKKWHRREIFLQIDCFDKNY